MSPVRVLASELINQIAAGEVVERPASVVKELVENAIDAGATAIDILLENGGKAHIEVRDNGSGMSAADAKLALERYATSKIAAFDDLARVSTLGFRGEALPSIASVSRFSLLTFDGSEEHGIEIDCDPMTGRKDARPAARDRGTTVTVRQLFENVPARRKFLRGADAEFRTIVSIVSSYALPLPERAFRVEHNGRLVLDLPPAAGTRERAAQIIGREGGEALAPIEGELPGIQARGFVTRGVRFGSRRNQFFFVNGRLVKDRVLMHAAHRAAEAFDFDGHPGIILMLEVDPEAVDVNVHPTKAEVRFRDSGSVHVAVERAIRHALAGAEEGGALLGSKDGPAREDPTRFAPPVADGQSWPVGAGSGLPSLPFPEARPAAGRALAHTPLFQQRPIVQPPLPTQRNEDPAATLLEVGAPSLGDLQGRIIGQYRMSYILVDTPGGLRLVDQHVAHERVLYDRYWTRVLETAPLTQQLLTPLLYEAGAAESAILESHIRELAAVGFEIERFSGNSFAISAAPPELAGKDIPSLLRKLVDASLEEKSSHLDRVREKVCASLACQAAIKVHRPLSGEEMARLVAELLDSSNPYACPHGRPIMVDIKHLDIERHFHRK